MRWEDDIMLDHADPRRGTLQLAIYAIHVITGNTLLCKSIRCATVKLYVNAAASLLALGPQRIDFRKDNPADKQLSCFLSSVYAEYERWEKVPDRQEPFTLEMLTELANECDAEKLVPSSLKRALLDFFEVGLFAGTRKSEWAQDTGHSALGSQKRDIFNDTRAFCIRDVSFITFQGKRLTGAAVLSVPVHTVQKCFLTFRTQKNGDHGEKRLFTQRRVENGSSFIKPMYRIVDRFVSLRGPNDFTTPLSVFKSDSDGTAKLITETDITLVMRALAAKAYNLCPKRNKKDLQKWSAHSLRIGACVILHAVGFSPTQIKWLLRWRSDAFMVYLRNLAVLGHQQQDALDEVDAMPNFL
jgi:hypothetical protein